MQGESYYLFLTTKDGKKYRVYSKGISLEEMDRKTTKYKNKKELVNTIKTNCQITDEIKNVEIMRKPNKNKEKYVREYGTLYSEDKNALNVDIIGSKFETKIYDREFVLDFIYPYGKIKNFNASVNLIRSLLVTQDNYFVELGHLVDTISSTYKGRRNIYLAMKKYEKKKENSPIKIKVPERTITLTKEEIRENELNYLIQYERELLDIEDFKSNEELSPFDGSKKR